MIASSRVFFWVLFAYFQPEYSLSTGPILFQISPILVKLANCKLTLVFSIWDALFMFHIYW